MLNRQVMSQCKLQAWARGLARASGCSAIARCLIHAHGACCVDSTHRAAGRATRALDVARVRPYRPQTQSTRSATHSMREGGVERAGFIFHSGLGWRAALRHLMALNSTIQREPRMKAGLHSGQGQGNRTRQVGGSSCYGLQLAASAAGAGWAGAERPEKCAAGKRRMGRARRCQVRRQGAKRGGGASCTLVGPRCAHLHEWCVLAGGRALADGVAAALIFPACFVWHRF
jgi:hypothetical protein